MVWHKPMQLDMKAGVTVQDTRPFIALRRLEPWRLDTRSGHLILLEGDGYASRSDAVQTDNACAADDLPG